jgi:hypothetical protein
LESNRLAYLRKSETYRGVSKGIFKFLAKGGRTSTRNTYNYGWKVFASWWNRQGFLDEDISPSRLVDFLMSKYWEGYSGSSIAGFRSAVSVTAPKWKGAPVGQSELVVQCMKNIDLKRPSEPAYATTWDLDLLTDWLNTFPSNQ